MLYRSKTTYSDCSMTWHDQLRDYVTFLKQKYELTDEEIEQELFSDQIPTDAFKGDATPLQAASKYLAEHYKRDTKTIARTLGRSTTEIEKFLTAAHDMPAQAHTGVPIPASIFADRTYSASEHLVRALHARGHDSKHIAKLLGKAEQTIWTLHYRIREKGGAE